MTGATISYYRIVKKWGLYQAPPTNLPSLSRVARGAQWTVPDSFTLSAQVFQL